MIDCVIDASALLALLQDEPGAERTAAALPNAVISSVNLSEVVSKLADRKMPLKLIRKTLAGLDLNVCSFDQDLAYAAGGLRPATTTLGLSLGDRACLALAQHLKFPVLTTDVSWAQVDVADIEVALIR
jgi:PIN domain nuclease of toxin-antitoxin system